MLEEYYWDLLNFIGIFMSDFIVENNEMLNIFNILQHGVDAPLLNVERTHQS